jgi:serine protease Do
MSARLLAVVAALVAATAPVSAQLTADSKLLAPFRPVVEKATESTVRVRCDDKDAALGTVVDSDGFILTKLSELKGVVKVKLSDGTEVDAKTVAADKNTDLALLKIAAKGLKAVSFADSKAVPRGNWVASAGPTSDPVAVGIVSVMTRKLTGRDVIITNPNRGYLGVFPDDAKDENGKGIGAKVTDVSPDGAAKKAGLLAGDVIVEMNGKPVTSQQQMRDLLEGLKGGEAVQVVVKRKDETKSFKVTLGSAPKDRGDFQNAMGSMKYTLSDRRTGFGEVLQTDMVIAAKDCGGPVVDLEGNVLGINIARAGRVETWVLPSEVIRPLLPQYKAGKFAPTSATATPAKPLPAAPAPHEKKK